MKLRTPDKGWAWVVLVASFLCTVFGVGVLRASGILFLAFRTKFDILREEAAWPLTIRKIAGAFAGFLIGFLSHFVNLKTLVITGVTIAAIALAACYFASNIIMISIQFGFLLGLGIGMLGSTNVIIINRYFNKYRTIALGILYSGTATGGFMYPVLTTYLLDEYDLQGCFLLLSSVLMQALIAVTLYKNPPLQQESTEKSSKEDQRANLSEVVQSFFGLFRTAMFHVIWFSVAIYSVTHIIYLTVFMDFALDCDIPQYSAVYILSSVSIAELCGRLTCGWIIDFGWMKRRTFVALAFLAKAIIYATIPMWNTYSGLFVTTLCLGFTASCLSVNVSALYTDYLGLKNLPLGVGTGKALNGFLHFASPSIIGYFRDVRGSYHAMFFYFAAAYLFSSFLWLLEPIIMKFTKRETTKL
ncbi:monocarboxylate transporter 13-like [Centruroides sculpturatus]|uniref:monocarboxylate transporter 13-like n=1 Tax=Centruroides sculpturatus TaxID=218467 RepID=UPI000C6DE328|nr:monocarboxylate transporter 13-like [Centruroides sculpturatus]